ncbi:uncharacterized protein LOC110711209 [Chenopodium quinoa]|uniref:uncharacterized protein LOC110711209 n=1 Tax=Chenopodium quinoa TaxID=63459 RepID=UPI000B784E52|nr:uncharacterized protein LOC110711209 [Chenopodium quinoa]
MVGIHPPLSLLSPLKRNPLDCSVEMVNRLRKRKMVNAPWEEEEEMGKGIGKDGIYPKWATFISAITSPQTPKQKLFTIKQESIRKDVERAFGVLQARFAIIRHPALAWSVEMLWKIVMACIIMHNMIVEDGRDNYMNYWDPTKFSTEQPENLAGSSRRKATTFTVTPGRYKDQNLVTMMAARENLRDKQINTSLKNDLLEHIWARFGSTFVNSP